MAPNIPQSIYDEVFTNVLDRVDSRYSSITIEKDNPSITIYTSDPVAVSKREFILDLLSDIDGSLITGSVTESSRITDLSSLSFSTTDCSSPVYKYRIILRMNC